MSAWTSPARAARERPFEDRVAVGVDGEVVDLEQGGGVSHGLHGNCTIAVGETREPEFWVPTVTGRSSMPRGRVASSRAGRSVLAAVLGGFGRAAPV